MSDDPERRTYVRFGPDTDVRCRIPGMEVVHVVGLSAGGTGMRVITDKPLPTDEVFDMSLDLGDDQPTVRCAARVVWQESRNFDFCNRHISGVAFKDMPDAERDRLVALLPRGE
ncbi:PilZ domain-containing protein [bacterium CPR1]|nr:PilZ domain-containing protein [bacterium CPR1]